MTTHKRVCRRGFTLVEMLVVMAIIAILAAILLPAIRAAVTAAKNNRIAQEISSLHQAVEAYKQKFGDYPPNFNDAAVVTRHFRKAFPRHTDNTAVTAICASGTALTQAEALVFWLNELCNDPRQPLTGARSPSDSTKPNDPSSFFTFDESRLVPTRTISLSNGATTVTLQLYAYVPKDGKDVPYIYFENRSYAPVNTTTGTSYKSSIGEWVAPYKTKTSQTATTYQWANSKTFQIICAGLDGQFGDTTVGSSKLFPYNLADATNNIVLYQPGDMDNLTNFSEGKILEDHLP